MTIRSVLDFLYWHSVLLFDRHSVRVSPGDDDRRYDEV